MWGAFLFFLESEVLNGIGFLLKSVVWGEQKKQLSYIIIWTLLLKDEAENQVVKQSGVV